MCTYSVLIPWADRPVLETTLRENRALFARHGVEVLVINAGGDRDALIALLRRAAIPNLRALDLPGAAFSRQLCLNIGARQSRGEFLLLLDADVMLRSDIFADAVDSLRSRACFVSIQYVFESDPDHVDLPKRPELSFLARVIMSTELVTHDGRRAITRDNIVPGKSMPTDSQVLLGREDLRRVGGFNSALVGYGYEDTDLQIRLQFHLGLERLDIGEAVHHTHDASGVDRQAWRQQYLTSVENYRNGRYLGTLDEDAAAWADRVVTLPV